MKMDLFASGIVNRFRVLLIDSCTETRNLVSDALIGCRVDSCTTLTEASERRDLDGYDLVLTELTSPGSDVQTHLRWIDEYSSTSQKPLMVLSQTNDLASKVLSFEAGALDFIPKSAHPLELRARIVGRLSRRPEKKARPEIELTIGPVRLDPVHQRCQIQWEDRPELVKLTPIEFRLLHLLLRRFNRVLTRQEIKSEIWGPDLHIHQRSIDKHVHMLKTKFMKAGFLIEAIHGVGYRMCMSDTPHTRVPARN